MMTIGIASYGTLEHALLLDFPQSNFSGHFTAALIQTFDSMWCPTLEKPA